MKNFEMKFGSRHTNKEEKLNQQIIEAIDKIKYDKEKIIVINEKYKDKFNYYCDIIPNTIIFSRNLPKDVVGVIMDRKWVNNDV